MASEEEVVIDLRKMKMPDLKRELQVRGLKVSGNKHELIERLQQYLEEHEGAEVDDDILKEEEEDGETDVHLVEDQKVEDSVLAPPEKHPAEKEVEEPETSLEVKQSDVEEGEGKSVPLHSPTALSDAEKLKLRAEKFGMTVADMNVEARKSARSERFGTGSAVGGVPTADAEKLKKRAERFGGVVSDTPSRPEDEEHLRKRQARFGGDTSTGGIGDVDKKKKRAERFGLVA